MKKYTDEELLKIVSDKALELGRIPKSKEVVQNWAVSNRFGSWNKALKAAGLGTNKEYHTKEALLKLLQLKASQLGRTPSRNGMKERASFYRVFGDWETACIEAGLKTTYYSDGELIGILKDLYLVLGRVPSISDISELQDVSDTTFKRHFGSWNKALKAAGLDIIHERVMNDVESDVDLVVKYCKFSLLIGRFEHGATANDLDGSKLIYGSTVFILRFGSINNLRVLAGFKTIKTRSVMYTREGLKDMLLEECARAGHRLSNREIDESERLPALITVLRKFRSTNMSNVWKEIL